MLNPNDILFIDENFKQIEDIIDSKKILGQYNISGGGGLHCRYAYSYPSSANENIQRYSRFDDNNIIVNEGDYLNNSHIKKTDSEITVVRVKCSELTLKGRRSKWDMHDIAIPGDGSHLGESPSLVNLVTLVGDKRMFETEEYLVPLSSWDPFIKLEERFNEVKCSSDSNLSEKIKRFNEEIQEKSIEPVDKSSAVCRHPSWAGKISKFIKKYCVKHKPIEDDTNSKYDK